MVSENMCFEKIVSLQHGRMGGRWDHLPPWNSDFVRKVCRGSFIEKLFRKIWANMFNKVVARPLLNRQVCRRGAALIEVSGGLGGQFLVSMLII